MCALVLAPPRSATLWDPPGAAQSPIPFLRRPLLVRVSLLEGILGEAESSGRVWGRRGSRARSESRPGLSLPHETRQTAGKLRVLGASTGSAGEVRLCSGTMARQGDGGKWGGCPPGSVIATRLDRPPAKRTGSAGTATQGCEREETQHRPRHQRRGGRGGHPTATIATT
jgi:hypothetical protein